MVRRLVLLRHGRTQWNAQRRFQGHADPPLDDVGRAQAHEVAPIIAALRPSVLISSSALRAVQTAEIVAAATGLPLTTDARLRERGLGHWEGLTLDEVDRRFPDEYAEWTAGGDVVRRGGESRDQVAERARAAIAELPAVPIAVVVTHGATAQTLTHALTGLGQRWRTLVGLANCHWTELLTADTGAPGDGWRIRGHNLGAPGAIVPQPAQVPADETSDADA